jgi:ketosteroid isomerase-like protein
MSENLMRGFVRAFCDALLSHDSKKLSEMLDDDVDWIVFGPIDLFPFFGQRSGKAAVLAMFAQLDSSLALKSCDRDSSVVDGEQSASLIKLTAVHKATGRTLSLRLAQFAQFRNGKVVRLRAVFDSFDAAEQALGREIDLTAAAA